MVLKSNFNLQYKIYQGSMITMEFHSEYMQVILTLVYQIIVQHNLSILRKIHPACSYSILHVLLIFENYPSCMFNNPELEIMEARFLPLKKYIIENFVNSLILYIEWINIVCEISA